LIFKIKYIFEVAKLSSLDYWQAIFTELLATIGMFIMGLVKTMATYMVKMIIPISIVMTQFLIIVFLPLIAIVGAFHPDFIVFFAMLWFSISFTEVIVLIVSYLHEHLLLMYSNSPIGSPVLEGAELMSGSFGFEMFLINVVILGLYSGGDLFVEQFIKNSNWQRIRGWK
jgi:hypothetical protein